MFKEIIEGIRQYSTEVKRKEVNQKIFPFLILYFPKWLYIIGKNPLDIKLPWINYNAISFLNKHVKKDMKIFEFGSGGSTKYWLNKKCKVYSVEHDKEWFHLVSDALTIDERINCKLTLAEPEVNNKSTYDASDPNDYISSSGKKFRKYASVIDEYNDDYFDLILIDGRARPSCIKHSIRKLKKGGYLVLDNSDREYYTSNIEIKNILNPLVRVFDSFGPGTYTPLFWQTTIWQK